MLLFYFLEVNKNMLFKQIKKILLCLFLLGLVQIEAEEYIRSGVILASSNLKFVLPKVVESFYEKYPDASVHIQYGSSGELANQIINKNKEYDIYFSANIKYPKEIYKAKKCATKPKIYAQGFLILVTPSGFDLKKRGLDVLTDERIKNIAIANKITAPYGVATMEVLRNNNLYAKVKNKIRYFSDTATVINNVIWRGDAGFLPKAALEILPTHLDKDKYECVSIDTNLYRPILQAYVVSQSGLENSNTKLFIDFIDSAEAKEVFENHGYKANFEGKDSYPK
jgi:molybdate transport system substrate-binding protein